MKEMINKDIKDNPIYLSIQKKVIDQLKEEIETGYVDEDHKYCVIDPNGETYTYNMVVANWDYEGWGASANSHDEETCMGSLDTIGFTPKEREYIKKHWSEMIWEVK